MNKEARAKTIFLISIVSLLFLLSNTSFVAAEQESTFKVSSLRVTPSEVNIGDEATVSADVTNLGNDTASYAITFIINGETKTSQTITLTSNETKELVFRYVPLSAGKYTANIDDQSVEFEAIVPKFRTGPVVKLRPVNDEISSSKDGLIELFFSNPAINEGIVLFVEVYVSVPSGIHVYGEGFAVATAAGTAYGRFEVPPGIARNIYVNIKADETTVGKSYFVHMQGLYYPNDNKDDYQPISLTHPFKVLEASLNPEDSAPSNPEDVSQSGNAGLNLNWSGMTPWIILAIIVLVIAAIAILARR